MTASAATAAIAGTTASDWEYRKRARANGIAACVGGATPAMRAAIDMPALCACTVDQLAVRYPVETMKSRPYPGLSAADKDIARACFARYAPNGWRF